MRSGPLLELILIKIVEYGSRPACPKWTLWTDVSCRIIDPFFMRTTEDLLRHADAFNLSTANKLHDLFHHGRVPADIDLRGMPSRHLRVAFIASLNPDSHLCGMLVIRTVKDDRRHRVTVKSLCGFLAEGGLVKVQLE